MPLGDSDHKRLDNIVEGIQQRWGANVLRKLTRPDATVPYIATGFAALDRALGIGGVPRGYITEVLGSPTSGMRTLTFKIIASAHAQGDMAAYIDLGRIFDADYAVRCGIDVASLLIVRPTSIDEAFDVAGTFSNGSVGIVVYDPGLERANPAREQMALNRLSSLLAQSSCACLCLWSHEETPDDATLSVHTALRLLVERERWLRRRRDIQGYRTRITILKNKFSPRPRQVSLVIGFSGAVDGDGT
jgi:recombination protein RecA